jgi:hypothetical protein
VRAPFGIRESFTGQRSPAKSLKIEGRLRSSEAGTIFASRPGQIETEKAMACPKARLKLP